VENFFDFQEPHPSDPPMPSLREYHLKLSKTAEAIMAMGAPTVVSLQEIENVGVLDDLAAEQAISQFHYQPVLIEGDDSRGIDVGYLVRGDRAEIVEATAMPAPEGLTSRPPLLLTITLETLSNETVTIYLLNNHFTSMSEGETVTEPRRVAQASWNLSLVKQVQEQEPDAFIVVLGDLNSFYESPPIDTLRDGGLRHVYEFVAPEIPYTYIYEGESETLDHILVSPPLYEHLIQVEALHIDADFSLAAPDDATPRHVSDHDPLIAIFGFD
jgi:predicted extracellular nuclease